MDFHLGIRGGSRLIPPKKNNDEAVKNSKADLETLKPDNSVHYESISSLKNRIQTKQNELKSKIQEYKHFCAQYGIEPDEEKINNWNTLSKRLGWIEKYITDANQEIAKITTKGAIDKLEAQSKVGNGVGTESVDSLKNRIQAKQNELKSKIQEYKHFCAQYGIEPDEEKINNWNKSINSALSKRLDWIEKYITEANQEIAKITTRTVLDKLEAQSDN